MKKLGLLLILLFTLTSCRTQEEKEDVKTILFNGNDYVFLRIEDNEEQYTYNGHVIEISYGETVIISTEIDEDIYIITGDLSGYQVTKNGLLTTICDLEESCSGFEITFEQAEIIDIILMFHRIE